MHADHSERCPRIAVGESAGAGADLVVLPDEPYRFTADDGPQAFPATASVLVSGRHPTRYGPSLVRAPRLLAERLARPVTSPNRP
ncbi:hypothetical protein GCM10012280_10190 [Wenjunlia tyrosinilytica]|uniref:Uncharacterized protein n=1 Tax=Wenjunlia tyrosinilytica TaxID=1544741 RepID=A0A917ZHG0_9ACTN|nr:hypothetical protein GCM10012280_10190 [Wenjunlia tyrosinilytica]